jgi:hypothetical protein
MSTLNVVILNQGSTPKQSVSEQQDGKKIKQQNMGKHRCPYLWQKWVVLLNVMLKMCQNH